MTEEEARQKYLQKLMEVHDSMPPQYRAISTEFGTTKLVVSLWLQGASPELVRAIVQREVLALHEKLMAEACRRS